MRMFKRADSKNETEVKKQDVKGRKRKIIFNMRVTEDERDQINQRAALSGLLKQEFCIQSLMHQKVVSITVKSNFMIVYQNPPEIFCYSSLYAFMPLFLTGKVKYLFLI